MIDYFGLDVAFDRPSMAALVMLESSYTGGSMSQPLVRPTSYAAVSFDGTASAHIITSGSLTHRADLAAKLLETTMPDR